MSARVFISCGQREGEREAAWKVAEMLAEQGFHPHVALEAQSLQDINSGVIAELRRSDYYLFIDFRRERLEGIGQADDCRGSLFSHQELAIVCALGFEKALFFREAGVRLEGLGAFMMANATQFENRATLPNLVAEAVSRRGWNPRYSRNLVVGPLSFPEQPIKYRDLSGRFLFVDIQNRRPEMAAAGAVARLDAMQIDGGKRERSPNRSPLKVTGQRTAFQQTIWPEDYGAFDLLCVDSAHGSRVYLNNALDLPRTPILFECEGSHLLHYEVFAPGFERLRFSVRLCTAERFTEATAEVVSECDDGA